MNNSQTRGMLKFHKGAYKAYKQAGKKIMAHQARVKMIEMYLILRKGRTRK